MRKNILIFKYIIVIEIKNKNLTIIIITTIKL